MGRAVGGVRPTTVAKNTGSKLGGVGGGGQCYNIAKKSAKSGKTYIYSYLNLNIHNQNNVQNFLVSRL